MEKFGLLNLLKAIDGLKGSTVEPTEAVSPEERKPIAVKKEPNADIPNFMYETLVRHEAMSNRLKNKK